MRQDQAIPNRMVWLVEKTSNRCGILWCIEIFSAVGHTHAILANGRSRGAIGYFLEPVGRYPRTA
jgi:hypothetical protein